MQRFKSIYAGVFIGAVSLLLAVTPCAQAAVKTERIISGLNQPLFVTAAPGDSSRLFIVEKGGLIKVYDRNSGVVLSDPFLNLSAQVSTEVERGLLGLAFPPDYATNGQCYVDYTDVNGNTQVSQFTVSGNANVANAASEHPILSYAQPAANHNGGWIDFGPNDGYLYIASGDGGFGNDPNNNGQNPYTPLGAMLRVDVNGDDFPGNAAANYAVPPTNPFVGGGGAPEVWAYGLRNPWRDSFDRANGDLYIADVGQDTYEELNFQHAQSTGGENYGWRLREGFGPTPTGGVGGDPPPDNVDPTYAYPHGTGAFEGDAITGGYVYRGPITPLDGQYFFGDYENSRIWSLVVDRDTQSVVGGSLTDWTAALVPDVGSIANIASFGQDADGNLYIVDINDGEVFLLTADPLTGDANGDFLVDGLDYIVWAEHFGDDPAADPPGAPANGDFNFDGHVDGLDYIAWASNFGVGLDGSVAVPEPGCLALLLAGCLMTLTWRRR